MCKESVIQKLTRKVLELKDRVVGWYAYLHSGVWHDERNTWKVKVIKTLSLGMRTFMDADLQSQACALTYRTLLAIVPVLALLLAIGRGFGLQNLLTEQLYKLFPAQHQAVEQVLVFVDKYLSQSSEGVFVGVGIVFLLWTLVSLLGNVEASFNILWKVSKGRSVARKITDYLAILLILPILMICIAGITVFMSTALKTLLPFDFMNGAITFIIDGVGVVLTWFFFAGAYMLIPNARVKFVNALVSGIFVGSAFQLLQWLFMSGVLYVSKYNAIYGSFSFLPLFLIWLQLVWLFTLLGALLCYAAQNSGQFDFFDDINGMSRQYERSAVLAVATIIVRRFAKGEKALTVSDISTDYSLPIGLVQKCITELHRLGLVCYVEPDKEHDGTGVQPAMDISNLTVGDVVKRMEEFGSHDFIPGFNEHYGDFEKISGELTDAMIVSGRRTKLKDVELG